jgi:peptidoglycan/LPS O-acetylase OafA/YrhL
MCTATRPGAAVRLPVLPALTGVRFFAAAAVLLFHYGAGFSDRIHAPSPVRHVLHNGFLGVSLFFVLSGFIITYSHFSETMSPGVVRRFLWARVARIYPVYLLALVLALPTVVPLPRPGEALAVLTMTQAWTPPASKLGFAWVMQAWTLSIEAAFYLLFPLYWPWVRRLGQRGTMLLALACAVFILAFGVPLVSPGAVTVPLLGDGVVVPIPLFRMAEFTYGMAICQLFVRWPRPVSTGTANVLEIGLALAMVGTLATADSPHAKALFTVLAGLFLLVTAQGAGIVSRLLSTRLLLLLGGASYAIYILQQPIHALCSMVLRAPYDQVVSPVATVIGAIAAFELVEQPARRQLMKWLRRPA